MNITLDFDPSVEPTLRPPDYYQTWDRDDWGLRDRDFPINRQKLVYLFPKPQAGVYEVRAWFSALFKYLGPNTSAPYTKYILWNALDLHNASGDDIWALLYDVFGVYYDEDSEDFALDADFKNTTTKLVLDLRKLAQETQAKEAELLASQPTYSPPESPIILPRHLQHPVRASATTTRMENGNKIALVCAIAFVLWASYSAIFA